MAAAKSLERASATLLKLRSELEALKNDNKDGKFLEAPILEADKLLRSSKTLANKVEKQAKLMCADNYNKDQVDDTLKKVANGVPTGEGEAL